MIVEIKVNYYELLDDGTMRIATNIEDFKAMLDGINPRIYCDYLYERLRGIGANINKGGVL